MRRLVIAALAFALAGCGRGPATAVVPGDYPQAMSQASALWALGRWSDVFVACDRAFKYADREGDARVIGAVECVGESAARMGKPELALPHHERLFEAYGDRLRSASGRHRLANNLGVLLVQQGRRAQGIAVLREALEIYAGTPYHIASRHSFPGRAMIVKNLARAWYDSAGEPEAKAWVMEQGAAFLDHMEMHANGVHLSMGASSAMEALARIGRRQGNPGTPAWEAKAREWAPLEAAIDARSPQLARGCENLALREAFLEVCMRELKSPG